MALTRLALTDFRNHQAATLMPGSNFVVLIGENGAGKTNILEAVSLLVPGRGLRGAALGDMARSDGPGGFVVAGRMGDVDLGVGTLATAPERRVVRINGAPAAAGALSEWLSIVWLTPAMDRLFTEGASERRRFLDRLVLALEPAHARHTTRYDAAMRQRNRLLAGDVPADPDWLGALEAQMAEHGAAISRARSALVTMLNERIAATVDGPFARAALALEGWQDDGELGVELAQGRSRDAAAGRTLVGPHRSDLAVEHLGKGQPAARCSTGEQKALLLGIVLAHADLVAEQAGRRPILLLDEIAAHLDPKRRSALFEKLASGGGQIWMTGTEADLFEGLGKAASWFRVEDGKVLPSAASHPSI
ncbi:DNA replication/repair protein RecF [Aquisediminimonas profunda]|uniref:DNA replication/repair protein RecF n=1 Tax=Aquisediminimonas profunda TaxID=1550733 RepID=UPI001C639C80|nr:DNA replication/repair protein RecF [Aquisediminimonas profunda]